MASTPEEAAVGALVTGMAALFDDPACCSNSTGNSWLPVTDHTFDRVAVIYDRRLVGMVLVVDED